ALSVTKKPALERLEQLVAGELGQRGGLAVLLGDALVVAQAAVRGLEAVVELVALEDVVVGARGVGRAQVRVDGASHSPDSAGLALDPDHDALLAAVLVHAHELSLGKAP